MKSVCFFMSGEKKVRLDITIRREFKEMARQMAKERRRSISALFEDLVEAEKKREKESKEHKSIGFHWPKDCPEDGHCANCRDVINKIYMNMQKITPPSTAILAMLTNEVVV